MAGGGHSHSDVVPASVDASDHFPAGGDLEPAAPAPRRSHGDDDIRSRGQLSESDRFVEKFSHSRRSEFEVVPLDDDGKPPVPGGDAGNGKEDERGPGKKAAKEKAQAVPARKMFAFADSVDYVLIFFGCVSALGVGAAQPGISLLLGSMINAFGLNGTAAVRDEVNKVALKLLYVGLAAALAGYGEVSFWLATGERQSSRIRAAYLRAILRQDVAFFDQETATGVVIARLSGDTLHIQAAIGEQVGKFLQFSGTFVVGYIIAFSKGWKLSLVIVASLPLLILAGAVGSKVIQMKNKRSLDAYAEAATVVEQILGSIRTVVSFSGEKKAVQDYDEALKKGYKVAVVQIFYTSTGVCGIFFVLYLSYALALWYAGILVTKDGYKGGDALTIVFSVILGGLALGQAGPAVSAFQLGQQAAFRMFEVIRRHPPIDSSSPDGATITDLKGDIDLHRVRFCYPTRPGVEILSNFSLSIASCSTAALVGASGSGKSTVVQLIERFYDPQDGRITLDGVDIKTLNVRWLRQQIGLVGQEPVLFQGSLKDNIAYGKDGATMEEIQAAAERANAAVFIGKFPEGYNTQVGEHGAHLSGGQKQRVAIARAILKNPRILLLDEATSALDSKSESVVQDALDRLMKERTTIVVAHRLSTIRHAHLIAVVEKGSIIQQGTHEELISNQDGAYYQLLQLQQVKSAEEPDEDDDEIADANLVSYQSGSSSRYSSRSFSFHGSMSGQSGKLDTNDVRANIKQASQRGLVDRLIGRKSSGGLDIETGHLFLNKEQSIFRFASLLGPDGKGLAVLGSFFALLHGISTPAFGYFLSKVVSVYFDPDPHELRRKANFWASMFVVLAVSVALIAPVKIFTLNVMGQKLVRVVRRTMFGKVLTQEIGWFDATQNSSGAISGRLSVDASLIQSLVGDLISFGVQNVGTIGGALLLGFLANWRLTLVVFAMMPLIGIQGYVQIKRSRGFGAQAKAEYEGATQLACDAVRSIRTVASFCAEDKVVQAYVVECRTPMKNGIRQGFLTGFGLGFSQIAIYGAYALSFWFGAILVERGKATFKEVFQVFLAIALSATSIAQTISLAPDLGKVAVAVDSIFGILDRKSSIDSFKTDGKTLPSVRGDVEFRNVKFRYPCRPDVLIFRKLSLVVPQGKTVALVGESGSGKSTVIALLERWYDPEAGSILLDNVNIKELQLKWLRQQMGLVSQEPVVFNDTIKANILYGRNDNSTAASSVSQEELEAATTAANAHKFISELPDGYNTMVGERGAQLSGGQKQRIAIARAIIKNPKVLLLDEATSALDAESERVVQEALDRVSANRTTIVIAHRLSTIKGADMIAVVKHRSIVEKGRHEDLISKPNGAYARLANLGSSAARRATTNQDQA